MKNYKNFFAFSHEPFPQDLRPDQLYPTQALQASSERLHYAINLGAIAVMTGDVGSGKSTALRNASSQLHPSQYRVLPIIAFSGSLLEIFRQIAFALGLDCRSHSYGSITKSIRSLCLDLRKGKQTPVLLIDEAHLMRMEVFSQLHTLSQYQMDSQSLFATILAGQNHLLDKLMYPTSRGFASRVVGRTHFEGLNQSDMEAYLKHHLEIAGIDKQLFSEEAILAIHQGSGGLLRRANRLATGALIAAAGEGCQVVSADHVRVASTEII